MCCRYYMESSPQLRPIVEAAQHSKLYLNNLERIAKPLVTKGEVFPDSLIPTIATGRNGQKSVYPMIWGYRVPGINRPIVNARTETVSVKRVFKDGWSSHRCIIPASWYLEWERIPSPLGDKTPGDKFDIMPRGARITYLCGIYRFEDSIPHCAILTRPSGDSIAGIHDRMPLILPREAIDDWINPRANPQTLLPFALTDMVIERSYC